MFDRKSIALKYLKGIDTIMYEKCTKERILLSLFYYEGWFLLDLLAALPFDLLYATCMFESLVRDP